MTDFLPASTAAALPATDRFHPESTVTGPATAILIQASISPNTRRAYRGALEKLEAWLDGRSLDDGALADWITHLHGRGLSASTAALAVAAVRFRARMSGMENPVGPITGRTLAGIRRSSIGRGRGQVAGVTWEEADRAVEHAMQERTLRGIRDAALVSVASDALLRVSEVVAVNLEDIERDPDGSAVLQIRRSKTDQEGAGAACYLGQRTVEVLDAWLEMAGIGKGPDGEVEETEKAVFRSVRKGGTVGERLSSRSARSIVTRRCGSGMERVSGHSLRVGSAISLARAGASLVELQQAGRWKSPEMPARYTRGESARRGAVARLRHGRDNGRRRAITDHRNADIVVHEARKESGGDSGGGSIAGPGLTPEIRSNGVKASNAVTRREACLAGFAPGAQESASDRVTGNVLVSRADVKFAGGAASDAGNGSPCRWPGCCRMAWCGWFGSIQPNERNQCEER